MVVDGSRSGSSASTVVVAIVLAGIGAAIAAAGFQLGRLETTLVLVPATGAVLGAVLLLALAASARRAGRREAKLSAELTGLSQRLLRLEERPPLPAAVPAADTDEIAADMAILSRLVVQLADRVTAHDEAVRLLAEADSRGRPADRIDEPAPAPPSPAVSAPAISASVPDWAAEFERLAPAPTRPAAAGGPAPASQAGRLELHLGPVVTLPQRRTRLLETVPFLRLEDGILIPEADLRPALEQVGELQRFDEQVLGLALDQARRLPSEDGLAVLVSLGSTPQGLGALGARIEADLETAPDLARRIVLCMSPAAWVSAWERDGTEAARLRRLGVAGCLVEPWEGPMDWSALAIRGIAYAKLASDRLLTGESARREAARAAAAGIAIIATDVRRHGDIPDLIELDIPLAGGPAFDIPRPARRDGTEPAPDTVWLAAGEDTDDVPAEGPTPFSAHLRRAAETGDVAVHDRARD